MATQPMPTQPGLRISGPAVARLRQGHDRGRHQVPDQGVKSGCQVRVSGQGVTSTLSQTRETDRWKCFLLAPHRGDGAIASGASNSSYNSAQCRLRKRHGRDLRNEPAKPRPGTGFLPLMKAFAHHNPRHASAERRWKHHLRLWPNSAHRALATESMSKSTILIRARKFLLSLENHRC